MKAKFFSVLLTLAAITWSCSNAQNQNNNTAEPTTTTDAPDEADGRIVAGEEIEECDDEFEDCNCGEGEDLVPVTFKGDKPTIVDFARAYLSIEDMGEGYGGLRDAFERYEKGLKPEQGELIVDKQNGYISYTMDWSKVNPGDDQISINEMCYWNCKDGRHKIFVSNVKGMDNGKYYETEVTGLNFLCYDSQTKTMEWYSADQLGALVVAPDLCWPVQDRDNNSMSGEDWMKYNAIATLPRTGKNIKIEVADPSIPASKHRTCELVWNGNGFDKKFNK